jgi:hypothetical protein
MGKMARARANHFATPEFSRHHTFRRTASGPMVPTVTILNAADDSNSASTAYVISMQSALPELTTTQEIHVDACRLRALHSPLSPHPHLRTRGASSTRAWSIVCSTFPTSSNLLADARCTGVFTARSVPLSNPSAQSRKRPMNLPFALPSVRAR